MLIKWIGWCASCAVAASVFSAPIRAVGAPLHSGLPHTSGNDQPAPDRGLKPYRQVITSAAATQTGVFVVHRIGDRVYFEIPKKELDQDFLWVSRIAKQSFSESREALLNLFSTGRTLVVRWERRGNRVLLCSQSYHINADANLPIARAVAAENNPPILMTFTIEAFGAGEAPVIDVTRLLTTEVPEFSAGDALRAQGFDVSRSFLERVTPYSRNIEAEVTRTYTSPLTHGPSQDSGAMTVPSATVLMHYSLLKLPENPMRPRLADERMALEAESSYGYTGAEQRVEKRKYLTRWRLEKRDPDAAVSEPVKPIVYYIDPATPRQWRPWIKRAIEDWQPAFEAAGFKNAILAKEAPSPQQDPDWSPEDIRYSVVRWVPSAQRFIGPGMITDPRSGEVLKGELYVAQNSLDGLRDAYFAAMAPLDLRARKFPFPDDLMGRLLEALAAHELSHTFGLSHNDGSSAFYPVAKLRDPDWVHGMGYVPSLALFPVFDYVAQPEDHIAAEDLIQKLGPYDEWAIEWAYKPIPEARTAEEEKPILDQWIRAAERTPWLRCITGCGERSGDPVDPRNDMHAVGGADPIYSTSMGLKNLHRTINILSQAMSSGSGDLDELKETYGYVLGQWTGELFHVAVLIGGVESQTEALASGGITFAPVSRNRQQAAVRFLNENAFRTPLFLFPPEVLNRIGPGGVLDYLRTLQASVLDKLFRNKHLALLADQGARLGAEAYRPAELLADLRQGIWGELAARNVAIDPYRRQLQRYYVQLLIHKVNAPEETVPQYIPENEGPVKLEMTESMDAVLPAIRAELKALEADIMRALPRAADMDTHAHLDALRDQIDRALSSKCPPAAELQNSGE